MRVLCSFCGVAAVAGLVSCTSGPPAATPPDIDPATAAQAAIDQYDQNGDGALSAAEIEDSALSLEKWDADRSGSLSHAEIEQRLTRYVEHGTAMVGLNCYVRLNGRPLENAQVTLKPEEFLGGAVHPAYGTTGRDGVATIAVAEEFRPRPDVEAAQIGLFKVEITHPEVQVKGVSPNAYEISPGEDIITPTFEVET